VEAGKELGKQTDETKKANEKLAEQIKATKKANDGLREQVIIADNEKKKAKHEARIGHLRLQHFELSLVDSLARTDPLRAQKLLGDLGVFPESEPDFAWRFQLARCAWTQPLMVSQNTWCSALSTDGLTLATWNTNGECDIWDPMTG